MAESTTDKPKVAEKPVTTKQSDLQVGSIGNQAASGVGAGAPPLDGAAVARIKSSPQQAPRSDMLALQRAVGNRAVAALVRGDAKDVMIQAKLEVGPVNDSYEQEADRIARAVTSEITQRKPIANIRRREDEEISRYPQQGSNLGATSGAAANIKRMLQRKSTENNVRADGSFAADASVHDRVRRMEGGGRPLPDSIRRQMEPSFGADFSNVRIHTGGDAIQLSRDIGARAFTHGSHIAFAAGNFNPNSQDGRHLLAHELTHTIQQTGARPYTPPVQRSVTRSVRRGPKGIIQRGSRWERFKAFVYRSEPITPVAPDTTVDGTPSEIHQQAFERAGRARDEGVALVRTAKSVYAQHRQQHVDTSISEDNTGRDVTAEKGNVFARGREATAGMKKGDKTHAEFLFKAVQDLEKIPTKLEGNVVAIAMVRDEVNAPVQRVAGTLPAGERKRKAQLAAGYAKESEGIVESIKKQLASMGRGANVAEAKARTGLDAKSLPAAEKNASDSAMNLMGMKTKVEGYLEYIEADLKVLEGHLASAYGSVVERFGESAAQRALGSGVQRDMFGGGSAVLSDEQAFSVGGEEEGMKGKGDESQGTEEAKKAAFEAGTSTAKTQNSDKDKPPKPPKKLNKAQTKFAKKLKRLELTSLLYARARKRVPEAKQHVATVSTLQEEALTIYNEIDVARQTKPNPTQSDIEDAVIKAGVAMQKVSRAQVPLEKMYRFKKEIYNESQQHEDIVGKRAMGSGTRFWKKTAGIIAGGAVRVFTGGLYSYSAEDEAGGYRVGLKSRTLIDDIVRKNFELEQILKGAGGKPVRGLGGPHGAHAYAFFKKVAFALQIIRDISSAIALWVTLLTAGVGAPVGVVFASISLFSTIAKGVIDLLLLGWSGAGLINTNDPRSRAILRAENTKQGLAFGEAAFAGASAGMVMGISGQTGLLSGTKQTSAFSNDSIAGVAQNVAIGPVTPLVGNIAQNVGVNNLSNYSPETGYETRRGNQRVEQVRKAQRAIAVLSHPVQSAFSSLADFMSKKKKLRESKFASVLPSLVKNIQAMNSSVQSVPPTEGGSSAPPPGPPPPLPPRVPPPLPPRPQRPPPPPPTPPSPSPSSGE